ncbi:hypothetical protein RRG08_058886 [Elysia crispata]|uniref:Uncharacterized protein n=1 Tax=Elysia crispata TaxID=231223 RepID=A0AAE0Y0Y8_9GAST|nr:hypothetical protein RRG08_058886 [Elysia crispata]
MFLPEPAIVHLNQSAKHGGSLARPISGLTRRHLLSLLQHLWTLGLTVFTLVCRIVQAATMVLFDYYAIVKLRRCLMWVMFPRFLQSGGKTKPATSQCNY